ncbi:MAG: hypothetical protein SGILL_007565, partial [Bacillariaceae sp.]
IVDQRQASEGNDDNNSDPTCRPPSEKSCQENPLQILCKFRENIDWMEYPAQLMTGPILARHLAHRMYRGEYFALQVDSHVRFVANWDDDIISQWYSTGNEMAVISTYMNDITNSIDPDTHESLRTSRAMMCSLEYEWKGDPKEHIRFNIQPTNKPKILDSPMLHPFFAAGFAFARGHFVVQVPYDQYLPFVFQGEEILQAVRSFTYGYDMYAPLRIKKKSYQRLNGIAGTTSPAEEFFDLKQDRYGLGEVRTKEQYFDTFGIHPSTRSVEEGLCDFVQGSFGVKSSMHAMFSPSLSYDNMGIDYSRVYYQHRTPERTDTAVDPQELAYLREKLAQNRSEK